MTTLADDLPRQQARCREILSHAQELGAPGMFLVMMLKRDLALAEQAAASGDVVGMLRAYAALKEYQE